MGALLGMGRIMRRWHGVALSGVSGSTVITVQLNTKVMKYEMVCKAAAKLYDSCEWRCIRAVRCLDSELGANRSKSIWGCNHDGLELWRLDRLVH